MYIEKGEMKAYEYIEMTRSYLDYLEEHIDNIRKAFQEVNEACEDMWWVIDNYTWPRLREDVYYHDISCFSQQEFVPYRISLYPVDGEIRKGFFKAWEYHKKNNPHHHESVETDIDVIHMIIDWTAVGYEFGHTAQEYYEKNKDKINLSESHKKLMLEIFDRIEKYNNKKTMDINDAIEYTKEIAMNKPNTQCGKKYIKIAKWLKELAEIKNMSK